MVCLSCRFMAAQQPHAICAPNRSLAALQARWQPEGQVGKLGPRRRQKLGTLQRDIRERVYIPTDLLIPRLSRSSDLSAQSQWLSAPPSSEEGYEQRQCDS
jgi:hypothetical protein